MAILCDEIKTDNFKPQYAGYAGSLRAWEDLWSTCRVTFHDNYDAKSNHPQGFFYKEKMDVPIQQALDVITEVEEVLKVKDRVKAYSANEKSVYCIEAGEWWLDPVRFTLLTILLRDAKQTLAKTLTASTQYLQTTKVANERFLSGHTFYQQKMYKGWVSQFNMMSANEVATFLSDKPPEHTSITVQHYPTFSQRVVQLKKI